MSEGRLHQLTQPSEAELTKAIATFHTNPTAQEAVDAALMIVGEACVQLGEQGKSQDEVVAFLTARGMSSLGAKGMVEQAWDVVTASAGGDATSATSVLSPTWGLLLFGIVAVIAAVYFLY